MNRIVLDSSAVLAMILNEPGGDRVAALLGAVEFDSNVPLALSSLSWCEILTRMQREKVSMTGERLSAVLAGVELVLFGRVHAEIAAGYAQVNQALSLGDRACLALAKTLEATAWTAERLWTRIPLDVAIELIRD